MRETRRFKFPSGRGHDLVGILERPTSGSRYLTVASHCFTCTKDLKSWVKLSRELVQRGIAVFRFDFTGLGESDGDFSRSTFADNCQDIEAALQFIEHQEGAVDFLIGHSLGGLMSLVAAARRARNRSATPSTAPQPTPTHVPHVPKAVITLGAPSETPHLVDKLQRMNPSLIDQKEGQVSIGGIPLMIRREMLVGLQEFSIENELGTFSIPTLILHSMQDSTVDFFHARKLFELLGTQASLLAIPNGDHLFTSPDGEIDFLARTIDLYASRWIQPSNDVTQAPR